MFLTVLEGTMGFTSFWYAAHDNWELAGVALLVAMYCRVIRNLPS